MYVSCIDIFVDRLSNLYYTMPHCMVPSCSNGWWKTKGTNITYRRVPSNHMNDVKHSFVCSEHFTSNNYVTSLAEMLCERKG